MFAVKRGEIKKRFDVRFNLPQTKEQDTLCRVSLGSLCLREPDYGISATAIARADESQPKYIRITDFSDNGIEDGHIFTTVADYRDKHILKDGDILFARSGSIGRTYQHDGKLGLAVFAGYCIRFVIDPEKAMPEYVYWYTKTKRYENWIQKIKRPTVQPNINKEEYKSLEIILPPQDEQKRLVRYISAASQKRSVKLQEADELLLGMDSMVLERLGVALKPLDSRLCFAVKRTDIDKRLDPHANQPKFTKHFLELRKNFKICKLAEITSAIFSGITPKSGGDAYTDSSSGIAFIRSGNIHADCTAKDTDIFIKPEIHNGLMKNSKLIRNDILIAIVGATIGKVGIYKSDEQANINQAIAAVRINDKRFLPEYILCCLQSSLGQLFLDYLKRPVARANINLEEVGNIEIPLISMEIQNSIVSEMRTRIERSRQLKQEAESEWAAAKAQFEQELMEGISK